MDYYSFRLLNNRLAGYVDEASIAQKPPRAIPNVDKQDDIISKKVDNRIEHYLGPMFSTIATCGFYGILFAVGCFCSAAGFKILSLLFTFLGILMEHFYVNMMEISWFLTSFSVFFIRAFAVLFLFLCMVLYHRNKSTCVL
jgi:hypothetical protein